MLARVRREWLDIFGRICAGNLVGSVADAEPAGEDWVQVQVRLRFGAVPAARTLLSFGANVEVVSPPEVRADLAEQAADVVARYSNIRLGCGVDCSDECSGAGIAAGCG